MIVLALGSNLGDREAYLARALTLLEQTGLHITAQSSLHQTPALLLEGAPAEWNIPFLNQVVLAESASHTPHSLLALLKQTEQALGRTDRGRWSPREIDIDLIAFHDVVLDDALLTLPHAQMHARHFVLAPLVEIAPHWLHPRLGKTASQLLAELPS